MTVERMFDILEEYVGLSDEAIRCGIAVGGYNEDTAKHLLYYWTGWGNFEGYLDEFDEDNEEEGEE